MNVLIFATLRGNDKFDDILSNISSAGYVRFVQNQDFFLNSNQNKKKRVVVICVHLENKQVAFDYINDILRVAEDMFYENDNLNSPFYQKLSGSTVIAGYGEMADRLIWINHNDTNSIHSVHSSIRGIVTLSPSLWRDINLLNQAKNMEISTLFIAGSTDSWRPISHQRPIYNQVRVCKVYVEIIGGNHCYFIDYDGGDNPTECYRKEMEYPSFKETTMSHQYQLNQYSARIIYEYLMFISNPSIESANAFQQYLINARDTTGGDLQYLQSCYVDNVYFAHDQYFPPDTEQKEYRKVN